MMDCKEALTQSNGDQEKAIVYLRQKGLADIKEREAKDPKQGFIAHYIHNGHIGVLVEVDCETAFVANSPDFQAFAHELALQVAASNPSYVSKEQVPAQVIDREKAIIEPTLIGKPPQIAERIVAGKLEKVYGEICLLEQAYVKDPTLTITDLLGSIAAKVGEHIVIKRFVRFVVGE
jgi:elongation factor Ts